jgi:hypothetical protein
MMTPLVSPMPVVVLLAADADGNAYVSTFDSVVRLRFPAGLAIGRGSLVVSNLLLPLTPAAAATSSRRT